MPDLGEAEIDTVLIAIGDGSPRERALVLVLLHCGLRADEAAALMWADVGLRWLRVGDAARTRQVPLPRATGEALQALARERLGEPVFADSRGRSISTRALYNIVAAAGERADVEGLNPRALRRACLNRHRRARRTLDQIAARMGYQCTLVVRRALGELAAELVPCTGCPGLPDLRSAHLRCGVCQGTGVTVEVPPAYADRVLPSTALGRLSGRARELLQVALVDGLQRSWVQHLRGAAAVVEAAEEEVRRRMGEPLDREDAALPDHEDLVPRLRAVGTELRKLAQVFVHRGWASREWGGRMELTGCEVDLLAARIETAMAMVPT